MSERTEILSVKLDAAGALKNLTDVNLALRRTADAQKALKDEFDKGTKTEREFVQGMAELKAQTGALNNQAAAYNRTLTAHAQLMETSNGSLEEMRAQLSGLTAQYSKLSKAERENKEIGGAMLTQMKDLSDELKVQEAAYGQTGRNVGNYTNGILQAVDGTGLLTALTEKAKTAQEGFAGAANIAKSAMMGNVSVLKLFRLALAATGIGLVVLALGGLVSYLTRTQKGIDFVNQKTKGLQIVFGYLMDKLSGVGEAIFNAFDNPKQAITDFIKMIETNLMNRLKSVMVIFDALRNRDFNKLQDGIAQMATGITDFTAKTKAAVAELDKVRIAGEAIERTNQRIRDSERELNVARANARAEIEKLKFVSEDATKSTSVRIAAAQKAFAMEQKFTAQAIQLQKEKIENIVAEQKLNKATAAGADELAEQRMKLSEIEETSLTKQIELNNMINSMRKEATDKAAADAAAKKAADEKAAAERIAAAEKEAEALKAIREKEFQTASTAVKLMFDKDAANAKALRAAGVLSETQYQDELLKIQMARMESELSVLQENAGKIEGIETEIANKQIEIANFLADNKIAASDKATEKAIANAQREAAETQAFIESIGAVFAASLTEQGVNLQKFSEGVLMVVLDTLEKTITAQIAASVATATAGSMAQPDSIATFGASGLIRAAVLTGLIKVAFGVFKAAIAQKMAASKPVKMAGGGVLEGASHADGGIKGTGSFAGIEVEGDEVIINKRSARKYRGLLNAINIAGGGKPLMPGTYGAAGMILAPTRRAIGGSDSGIDYNKMAHVISQMPAPEVAVREIIKKINMVQTKENRVNA